jgi:hypothetical protein
MRSGKNALLLLSRAGMEISWCYAWAGFLTLSIAQRRFPLTEAAGAFATAAFLTHLPLRRTWRVYQTLLLQLAGFVLFALLIVYRIWYERLPFFSLTWVGDLLREPKEPPQWFILVLILFCLFLIWKGGRTLVKDPKDYFPVCLQFDKGLGLFFLLLLIQFLVQKKAGIFIEDGTNGFLIFAFFIFSLVAIGLTRDRHDVKKSFLSGYHGVGIILSFTTIILVFGSGTTLLFYPHLTHMADSLQVILRNVTEPMVPVIVKILSFLFIPGKIRNEIAVGSESGGLSAPAVGGWEAFWLKSIGLGLMGIIGLMAIGVFVFILNYLLRWLLKRNTKDGAQSMSASWLLKLLERLISIPLRVWNAFVHLLKGFDSAAMVYSGFLRWGRRSGLAAIPTETPTEYGCRVKHHFPKLKEEIEMIVEAFNREVYGQFIIDKRILSRILSARRKMRNPRHWPSRMRVWFFQ